MSQAWDCTVSTRTRQERNLIDSPSRLQGFGRVAATTLLFRSQEGGRVDLLCVVAETFSCRFTGRRIRLKTDCVSLSTHQNPEDAHGDGSCLWERVMNSLHTEPQNAVSPRSIRASDIRCVIAVYDLFAVSLLTPLTHVKFHLSLQERLWSPDRSALGRQITATIGARMQTGRDCSRPPAFCWRFRGSSPRAQVQDASLSSGGLANVPLAIGNGASNDSVVSRRDRSGVGSPRNMCRSHVHQLNARWQAACGSRALTTPHVSVDAIWRTASLLASERLRQTRVRSVLVVSNRMSATIPLLHPSQIRPQPLVAVPGYSCSHTFVCGTSAVRTAHSP